MKRDRRKSASANRPHIIAKKDERLQRPAIWRCRSGPLKCNMPRQVRYCLLQDQLPCQLKNLCIQRDVVKVRLTLCRRSYFMILKRFSYLRIWFIFCHPAHHYAMDTVRCKSKRFSRFSNAAGGHQTVESRVIAFRQHNQFRQEISPAVYDTRGLGFNGSMPDTEPRSKLHAVSTNGQRVSLVTMTLSTLDGAVRTERRVQSKVIFELEFMISCAFVQN